MEDDNQEPARSENESPSEAAPAMDPQLTSSPESPLDPTPATSNSGFVSAASDEYTEPQPLLPRFGMVWFFILVLIVAIALFVIRAADQAQALSAAMVFTVLFAFATLALSGMSFLVAYLFGALEKAVEGEQQRTGSPFIDGSLPEQIIPPKPADEV